MLQSLGRYRPPPGRLVYVGQDVVLLRIGIAAAREILQIPLSDLTDLVVPLNEVNQSLARELAQRFETGRLVGAFDRVPPSSVDARFLTAARALARRRSVGAAAAQVALTERHLERLFNDRVGVSPKLFARIVRFRRAVFAARLGAPLAVAAAENAYADQSHFTREAHALTNRSPRSLLPGLANVASVQDADR
jgi:AraC-like DNA-binding protein